MKGLEWHFTDYPPTGLDDIAGAEYHWSDEVLIKCTNGDLYLAFYNEERREWYVGDTGEWIDYSQVACWASYGKVPETTTPMPSPKPIERIYVAEP